MPPPAQPWGEQLSPGVPGLHWVGGGGCWGPGPISTAMLICLFPSAAQKWCRSQMMPPPGGSLHLAQLEMLKQFDLSWEYGPCTGITRLQRWERAKSLGLSPPLTVRETLLEHEGDPSFMHCLWHDYPL
uniref:DNA polymerase delta 4, accessory subunit n=1 Tax=Terrapene triunguis TaxID=2587831 RepID=A0A674JQS2_9SAUR